MLQIVKELGKKKISSNSNEKRDFCIFMCICGNTFEAQKRNVLSGNTKSCGCLQKKRVSESKQKHKMSNDRLYRIFYHIKGRCFNKKHIQYKDWGGRGITICEEWMNNFKAFCKWALENGYKNGLSIDRINNNGNYEPANCRWVSRNVQARNTRKIYNHNTSGYRGVSFNKNRGCWVSIICVNSKNILIGSFKDKIKAAKAYDKYVIDNNLEHTKNFS